MNHQKIKLVLLLIASLMLASTISSTSSLESIVVRLTTIVLLAVLSFMIALSSDRNPANPLLYFPLVFSVYHITFPLYFILGGTRISSIQLSEVSQSLDLASTFLITFILTSSLLHARSKPLHIEKSYSKGAVLLTLFLFTALFIPAIATGSQGVGKEQRMIDGVSVFQTFWGGIYLPFALLIVQSLSKRQKFHLLIMLIILVIGAIGYIRLHERDFLVYPVLVYFFCIGFFRKISSKKLILFLATIPVFLFFLGVARSASENGVSRELGSLLLILQENEFISTGRNLAYLISLKQEYTNTLLGDITSSFFVETSPTGTRWFSENAYQNKGFGLVAEGYLNFGYVGVIFLAILTATIANFFYNRAKINSAYAAINAIIVISILYSIRSDFASIASGISRKIAIPLLAIMLISSLARKNGSTVRSRFSVRPKHR